MKAPWMTNEILDLLHKRDNLLKKATRTENNQFWFEYKAMRNKVVNKIRMAKQKFYKSVFENDKGNVKAIWNTIKRLTATGKRFSSVDCLRLPDGITENKLEIADLFNKHFTSIADRLRSLLPNVTHDFSTLRNFVATKLDGHAKFKIPEISISDVLGALKNLKSCKSTGIDNISARFLKIAAPQIAPFITKIINISFETAVFPTRWKTAKVVSPF